MSSQYIHVKKKLIRIIKLNKVMRFLVKPLYDFKARKIKEEYNKSIEPMRLLELKNKYYGESIFLVGNGPSLTIEDLEHIKGKHCFGMNEIYALFDKTTWRPEFYISIDKEDIHNQMKLMPPSEADYIFYRIDAKNKNRQYEKNIYWIYSHIPFKINKFKSTNPYISEDITKEVREGYTVMFSAIQLAIYFGFKRIYLIGVDNQYKREIGRNGKEINHNNRQDYAKGMSCDFAVGYPDHINEAYAAAKEYCDMHGIEIFNATRGGALEIFKRVDFDKVVVSEK